MAYTIQVSGNVLTMVLDEPLVTNRIYDITLLAGISGVYNSEPYVMSSDYNFSFTSLYCPLFTTVTKVRLEAGPAVDAIPDDTIYRLIHKNSLDAVDLANTYKGTTLTYDTWGCTWHDVPIILRRYVECKTAYDLLALIDLVGGSGGGNPGGSQTKTLGDMTIVYGGSSGSASTTTSPNKKKQLYDCWTEALKTIQTVGINAAVRGLYDFSKGYSHPAMDCNHNRIIRTVDFRNADPAGPWEKARNWRGRV
jgi:hypothetical protein